MAIPGGVEMTEETKEKVQEANRESEVDRLRFKLMGEQLKAAKMEIEFYQREVEVAGMKLNSLQQEQAKLVKEFSAKYGPDFVNLLSK